MRFRFSVPVCATPLVFKLTWRCRIVLMAHPVSFHTLVKRILDWSLPKRRFGGNVFSSVSRFLDWYTSQFSLLSTIHSFYSMVDCCWFFTGFGRSLIIFWRVLVPGKPVLGIISDGYFRTLNLFRHSKVLHSSGRGPTGLRARIRNRGRLKNRSHVVPKTEFQDGGDRTRIFTHKIIILAWRDISISWHGVKEL